MAGNYIELGNGAPGFVNSITRFGADKTGTVSSNAAILAAIAAHGSAYVPEGTFSVGDLQITGARIYGIGTFQRTTGSTHCLILKGSDSEIDGLTFNSSGTTANGNAEINLGDGCVNATVKNCKFTGSLYACVSGDVNGNDDTSLTYAQQVNGFHFEQNHCSGSYSRHLYLHNIKDIRIINNHFESSLRDSIRLRQAIEKCIISGNAFDNIGVVPTISPRPDNWSSLLAYTLNQYVSIPTGSAPGIYQCTVATSTIGANPTTSGAAEWNYVDNNYFETKDAVDTYWSGRELIITNNLINKTAQYGLDIKGSEPNGLYTTSKVIVSNNIIQNCFGCGINVSSADLLSGGSYAYTRGYIVSNNYLRGNNFEQYDVSQGAIHLLQGVSDCIIQGNMVVENYSRGITVANADSSTGICKNISIIDNQVYSNGIPGGVSNVGINVSPVDGLIIRGNIVKNNPDSTLGASIQTLGINIKDWEVVGSTTFQTPVMTAIVQNNIVSGNNPSGDRYDVLLNNAEVPSLFCYVDTNFHGNTTTVLTMARTMFSGGADSSSSTHLRSQAFVQIQGRIVLKARVYGAVGNLNSVTIQQDTGANKPLSVTIAPAIFGGNEIIVKLPTNGAGSPVAATIGDLEDLLKQSIGQGLLVYQHGNTQPQFGGHPITATAPLTYTGSTQTLAIPAASGSANGYLSSTDWNTFNGKEGSLGNPAADGYLLSSTAAGVRSWVASSGGGVASVTASSPVASSGGANPNITIQQATTSQSGYLSSTDWNTFNGKEGAITAGTTSQYWRGDKSWQTLDKTAVGLSNVPNTDATVASNITQDSTHRFATDTEKTTWNAKLDASKVQWAYVASSDQTTSSSTLANVTNMGFTVGASEVWGFEFPLQIGCNNTGGVKFALTFPSGATVRAMAEGSSTGITAQTSSIITASGTVTGVAYNTVSSTGGRCWIHGTIINSTTAGTLQLQFASGTDTQTSTVFHGSYMRAWRIA